MNISRNRYRPGIVAAAMLLVLPVNSFADAAYDGLKKQVETLQKQLQQVQETLKRYQESSVSKEEFAGVKNQVNEVSETTSEWKNADSVVHLAGYGDATYSDGQGKDGAFTGARFNPIFHYQYKDLVMLEAELEMEVEDDGGTATNLEYAAIDLFANDYLALVGGKFLSPLGQFRQNFHPSWINKLPTAPPGFGHDQTAPVSEVGLQARGGFPVGRASRYVNYAAYVGNGPVLELNGSEIEAIGAEGRTYNDDDKFVYGGRVGFLPVPKLEIDVKATLKAKLDVDRRSYTVLGACNPPLAHRALEADPDIGLLLPCNVVVRQEDDDSITVAFMDPANMLALVDQPGIASLAADVRGKLEQVKTALRATSAV